MELQYFIVSRGLLLVAAAVALGTLLYIVIDLARARNYLEGLLRLMAVAAGVIVVSVSLVADKPVPVLLADMLFNANPLSFQVILFGFVLPAVLGCGVGLFLIRSFMAQSSRSFRVLCLINSAVVMSCFISIAAVADLQAAVEQARSVGDLTRPVYERVLEAHGGLENLQKREESFHVKVEASSQDLSQLFDELKSVAGEANSLVEAIRRQDQSSLIRYRCEPLADELVRFRSQVDVSLEANLASQEKIQRLCGADREKHDVAIAADSEPLLDFLEVIKPYLEAGQQSERDVLRSATAALGGNWVFLGAVFIYIVLFYKEKGT